MSVATPTTPGTEGPLGDPPADWNGSVAPSESTEHQSREVGKKNAARIRRPAPRRSCSHSRSSSSLRSYPTSFPIRSLPHDRRLDLNGRNAGPQNARKGSACIERRQTCSIRVNEPDLVDPTIRPPEKPSNRELVISARSPASNML